MIVCIPREGFLLNTRGSLVIVFQERESLEDYSHFSVVNVFQTLAGLKIGFSLEY